MLFRQQSKVMDLTGYEFANKSKLMEIILKLRELFADPMFWLSGPSELFVYEQVLT